jgi:hypothetical protein
VSAVTAIVAILLAAALDVAAPQAQATPVPEPSRDGAPAGAADGLEPKPPRPEDKTLVASLDSEQGEGKDRLSLYRDGTLALVKTYAGVRTVKTKTLSEEEIELVRRVCSEALSLDVAEYHVDVLGRAEPRRFRIEIGRPDSLPRVFLFDELARVPLVLGRARGALEGFLARFDENAVSQESLWDPAGLRAGDILKQRTDGKRYRIVRDDAFVRSLEMVEEERTLQRLVILREDVPKLFLDPSSEAGGGSRR